MSLPRLPPLRPKMPTCDVCGKPPTRFVQTSVRMFNLCDACEPPDVIPRGPVTKLPPLPSLAPTAQDVKSFTDAARALPGLLSLPSLSPSSASKATINDLVRATEEAGGYPELDPYPGCPPARVLVIDDPWTFGDATPHKGAEDHYKCLTIDEIKAFPLPPLADDAILFMWRVGAGNEKDGSLGEKAYEVMRHRGFTPKSELVWHKTRVCKTCDGKGHATQFATLAGASKSEQIKLWCEDCHGHGYKNAMGMGRYVRGCHEICLIGTRGKAQMPDDKSVRSVFCAPRLEHSRKPPYFYELVEKLYENGPYVELFARRRREGWHCYGDELPPLGAP